MICKTHFIIIAVNRKTNRNRLMKETKKYSKQNNRLNWIKEQTNIGNTFKLINEMQTCMSIQKVLKIQKEKSIDRFKWINRIRRWDLT